MQKNIHVEIHTKIKKLMDEIKNGYNIYSKFMQTMKKNHAELQPSQRPQKPEARSQKKPKARSQEPKARSQTQPTKRKNAKRNAPPDIHK